MTESIGRESAGVLWKALGEFYDGGWSEIICRGRLVELLERAVAQPEDIWRYYITLDGQTGIFARGQEIRDLAGERQLLN